MYATSLDFLRQLYRDPAQPIARRVRAAIAALPFGHPKLTVVANVGGHGFAEGFETAIAQNGKVVEIKP